MSELSDFALTVLSSAGATVAFLAAAGWLLRTWIAERLSAQVRHEYDRKLAELNAQLKRQSDLSATQLKADLDRLAERLKHSAQTSAEVQKATIERRIAAVDEVWAAVLDAEAALPAVFVTFDVLLDSEYDSTLTNPRLAPDIRAIDHFVIISGALDRSRSVGLRRPFVGSYLWSLYGTYRAVLFRMIYLVSEASQDPARIHWYSDKLVRDHIGAGLGEDALKNFDGLRFGRVSWVRNSFSKAILDAMDIVVAGRDVGEAALHQAERMEKLLTAPGNTAR